MRRFRSFLLATTLLFATCFAATAQAGVNDFTVSDFQADYYLTKDSEGRSQLKTVERITAEFPGSDQNHGIERAIPSNYRGHPTHLSIQNVTNGNGDSLNYSTYTSNDNRVIRIGDADRYVHGTQVYVITYEQRDVTLAPDDKAVNEFYWDTNGTLWQQPFGAVTARIHLDQVLAEQLNGDMACYVGVDGSNERCTITKTAEAGGALITAASDRTLMAGENVTFALGFRQGTFAAYQPSVFDTIGSWFASLAAAWAFANMIIAPMAVGFVFYLILRLNNLTYRKKELGTIVPEYLPPREYSVTTSSIIARFSRSTMTAQLLDLAVRHYIKLYEVKEKTFFSPAQYEIEIVRDTSDLRPEEREILNDMFDNNTAVGQRLNLKTLQNSMSFYRRTLNNDKDLDTLIRGEYGLMEKRPERARWLRRCALVLLIVGVVLFSPWLLAAALFAFIFSFMTWSLTDKGLELMRYLEGLKLYIKVAEQERIKMLQSPQGAEKVASVTEGYTEPVQLVKLYERVLPYAVLFGQEKQWATQLGAYYETVGAQPEWYSGNSAVFNAAVFSSAMSSFSMSTSTYASSSSSSSSGSGGGGSSGGGGGGGGGGGW